MYDETMEGDTVAAPGSTMTRRKWDADPVSGDELESLDFALRSAPARETAFSTQLHDMLDGLDVLADIDNGSGLSRKPRSAVYWPLILAPPGPPRSAKSRRRAGGRMALTPHVALILLTILLSIGLGTVAAGIVFEKELSSALDRWDGILRNDHARDSR